MVMWRTARPPAAGVLSSNHNSVTSADTMTLTYPAGSLPGDQIIAIVAWNGTTGGNLVGSDVLTEALRLQNALPTDTAALYYGQRGAETGAVFTWDATNPALVGIVVSFPSDNAGAVYGGAANSVAVSDDQVPGAITVTPSAVSLLLAFDVYNGSGSGPIDAITSTDDPAELIHLAGNGTLFVQVKGYEIAGSTSVTFDGAGFGSTMIAYAYLDARYVP